MMSRRRFLKYAFLSVGLLFSGVFSIFEWFLKGSRSSRSLTADTDTVSGGEPGAAKAAPQDASDAAEPLLSFFLLSDLHISVSESSMSDKLKWALDDLARFESKVEAIVLGGDLTDFGRESDYRLLKSIMDGYKLPPVYGNMGNHDYYDIWLTDKGEFSTETMPNGKTDEASRKRFQKFIGYKDKTYDDVWINGVHLIMVSQEAYVQERPEVGEGAWYSDEQLAWLKEKMTAHEDGKPAFVFIHQPLPEPGSDGRTHQLIRAKEFRAILAPYKNVFVFSGHTHRDFRGSSHYTTGNTFHWFNNSSVGRCRGLADSSSKAQGMYVQVYKDKVHIRGREFSDRSWIADASWEIPLV